LNSFRLPFVLWGIALWQILMTFVAYAADWPAQFGSDGSSPDGVAEWFQKGTALSAPMPFIIATAAIGGLATMKGRMGFVGDLLGMVIAAFTIVASLGETFAASPVTAPRGVLIVSGVLGVALAAIIMWAGLRDLRLRRSRGT
jgi:hypothetical protein